MFSIYILYINCQGQGIEHSFVWLFTTMLYSSLKKVYAIKRHGGNLNNINWKNPIWKG